MVNLFKLIVAMCVQFGFETNLLEMKQMVKCVILS